MAGVEASGKTIEEAIDSALAELGADRDDVDVEVLNEPRGGILGVGGQQARVRVRLLSGEDDDLEEEEEDADDRDRAPGERPRGAAGPPYTTPSGQTVEDEGEFAAQMLDKLLELMGITGDVSIRDCETAGDGLGMARAVLDVEGEDLGILIGRRGETLASLQYLLNLMVARQLGEHMIFTVDVEGYRQRRERQLRTLAQRTAETVRRTRRAVTLDPMPPNERRIIHLTLAEDRYVSTSSAGEGDERRVAVSPK